MYPTPQLCCGVGYSILFIIFDNKYKFARPIKISLYAGSSYGNQFKDNQQEVFILNKKNPQRLNVKIKII
jgi:hypothetical protein